MDGYLSTRREPKVCPVIPNYDGWVVGVDADTATLARVGIACCQGREERENREYQTEPSHDRDIILESKEAAMDILMQT